MFVSLWKLRLFVINLMSDSLRNWIISILNLLCTTARAPNLYPIPCAFWTWLQTENCKKQNGLFHVLAQPLVPSPFMQIFHSNLRFKHQPGPIPLIKNIMVQEVLIKMNISLTALLIKQSSLSTDLAFISAGPAACQLGCTCPSQDSSKAGKEGEAKGASPGPLLS